MPHRAKNLPHRRPELVLRPLGDKGQHVVKDPGTGEYFSLGEHEHFLLTQLNGHQTAEAIRAAYAQAFGEPLSEEDLNEFLELARSQGFLEPDDMVCVPPRDRAMTDSADATDVGRQPAVAHPDVGTSEDELSPLAPLGRDI